MRILLIQPNSFDPIGLKVIGSFLLKNGIEARIYNYAGKEKLVATLNEFKPPVVGVTIWTGSMILAYLDIVEVIREKYPEIKIIVGGPHASLLPEQVIEESDCDFVVCGDGETATLKILQGQFKGEKGILYREAGQVNGNMVLREDSLDLIESIFLYYEPRFYKKKWSDNVVRTYTSKGCPYLCSFCYRNSIDPKMRYRDLGFIKNELVLLKEKYGVKRVNFFDDNFALDKKRVYEISKVLKELGMKYQFSIRINQLTEEFVKTIAGAGCVCLYLGIESGNERVSRFINKNFTLKMIREKIELLQKYNLTYHASFLINLPTETKEELNDTKRLALEIGGETVSSFSLYAPYPKTRLYEYIQKNCPNVKLPSTLKEWADINWFNFINDTNELTLEDIKEFCDFFHVHVFESNELHKTSI